MTDIIGNSIITMIKWTHQSLISCTEDLTDQQIAQQPSLTAPPIGWHLFHIARWADRLQASFLIKATESGKQSDLHSELWVVEGLTTQWGLKPESFGLLETGTGMDVESAVSVALLGKSTLLEYARRTFAEAELAIDKLNVEQLQQTRRSILPQLQVSPAGHPYFSGEREVAVLDDLLLHVSHAGRHLGMIEALRGALFAIAGTASV